MRFLKGMVADYERPTFQEYYTIGSSSHTKGADVSSGSTSSRIFGWEAMVLRPGTRYRIDGFFKYSVDNIKFMPALKLESQGMFMHRIRVEMSRFANTTSPTVGYIEANEDIIPGLPSSTSFPDAANTLYNANIRGEVETAIGAVNPFISFRLSGRCNLADVPLALSATIPTGGWITIQEKR